MTEQLKNQIVKNGDGYLAKKKNQTNKKQNPPWLLAMDGIENLDRPGIG